MTDLKELLESAAGTDPAFTDEELLADLRRGKRSVRRRQFAAMAGGATAVALVAVGAWAVLPGGQTAGLDAPAAGSPTPLPLPPIDKSRIVKVVGAPVPLVADGVERSGVDLVCGLKPKGWRVTVFQAQRGMLSEMTFSPPQGNEKLVVRHAGIHPDDTGRMLVEKYDKTWEELPHVRAGSREAVVAGTRPGMRDVHIRIRSTKLIQVYESAPSLHWDLATLLRFTGSCDLAK
ncbi:hypothetical protein AB0P21_36725 [Kribbella sp. NPDC056861]|uniref:hypothetical protein n=1 Tax=Kribbella sp. NPDC056861 TaxID=3154857 RepID=UPI003439B809